MRDVSERKKFERELQETQKLESLGLLAGGIAHDFNNLLTGILGNASLALSETAPDQPVRFQLRQVVDAAERAAFLTRQMLAYAGKGKFLVEPVDVSAAAREIRALLGASVSKNINVVFQFEDGLAAVEGDRGQIQQVVMNLVLNAAEAIGPEQSGTIIVVTGTHHLTDGELARAVVRDFAAAWHLCLPGGSRYWTGNGCGDTITDF
jgi:signal transduction histidine kinase